MKTNYNVMEEFFIQMYDNPESTFVEDMAKITTLYNTNKYRVYDFIYYITHYGVYNIEDATKFLLVIYPHLSKINYTFDDVYELREELAYISLRNHKLNLKSVGETIQKITKEMNRKQKSKK